jgi:hypothetical protein
LSYNLLTAKTTAEMTDQDSDHSSSSDLFVTPHKAVNHESHGSDNAHQVVSSHPTSGLL